MHFLQAYFVFINENVILTMNLNLYTVQCQALSTTSYLNYDMSTDGTTTSVELTCDTGSSMNGENILSCLPDGSWSNPFPICGIYNILL